MLPTELLLNAACATAWFTSSRLTYPYTKMFTKRPPLISMIMNTPMNISTFMIMNTPTPMSIGTPTKMAPITLTHTFTPTLTPMSIFINMNINTPIVMTIKDTIITMIMTATTAMIFALMIMTISAKIMGNTAMTTQVMKLNYTMIISIKAFRPKVDTGFGNSAVAGRHPRRL